MEEILVWLLAAYGCSSLLVMLADKWADRMSSSAEPSLEHYRLLVRDSEQVLEAVVRRLLFRSYWSGKPIRISLVDSGSTDDTRKIASVYERDPYFLPFREESQDEPEPPGIVIDLRQETKGAPS